MKALSQDNEKLKRRKFIFKVIESENPQTQDDLVEAVRRGGYSCTQTTISRDLAEMNVIKMGKIYRSLSETPVSAFEKTISDHALGISSAGDNLIVLKTRTGSAQIVAVEMDRAQWPEIVGTIAGDDTIFVAVRGKRERDSVEKKLKRLLGGVA